MLSFALMLAHGCSSVGSGGEAPPRVTLVKEGQAAAAIYVAERVMKGEPTRLRSSVEDLARCLEKMSDAKVEIVIGAPKADDKRLPILIGELAEERFGPPKKKEPYKQGLRLVVSRKGIGLLGESDLAASYAIYELLDRLGCRWYMPSEMGEVIPKAATVTVEEMDLSSVPYTIYRGIWYCDEDYKRRNRLGGPLLHAGHALEMYITADQLKAHPEWRATDEQGRPTGARRLKWSCPGLAEALADNIIAYLDKNPGAFSVSLSQDDGMGFDSSPQDRALDAGDFDPIFGDNSITDRLLWFCNRIADRITRKYPDVLFGMLAYGPSNRPPVREKVHPNIIPQIAPITYSRAQPWTDDGEPNNKAMRRLLEGWGKAAKATSYYFYGWFLAEPSAPNPFITKWSVNIPLAYQKGSCRFWQPETTPNFETTMQALYLGIRMSWDPSQDPKAIIDELHRNFYGHAAKEMAEYWHFIDSVWVDTPEYAGCGFGHMRRWTPERMAKARELLNKGIAAAQTPAEKARVKMADESLRMFELFMKLRHDLSDGRFESLAAEAAQYQADWAKLSAQYKPQFAFTWLVPGYFKQFYQLTYDEASRVAKDFAILTRPPMRQWRYQVDEKRAGEPAGWAAPEFDDSGWKVTDPCVDTWSDLGYHNYMGPMWYRCEVTLPEAPAGKKVYLWIGATDGSAKVFVNGKHTPCVTPKGERVASFTGYASPASFDITEAVRKDKNKVAIFCVREFLNELGTGGLLGPVVIYRDKD